ncbi:MAG TPA: hypothetical protein VI670_27800 [Thermoanaerobaculia bacterium]|jgi:hypothetical protein
MSHAPNSTDSTVALRILLQDCENDLLLLETKLSRGKPVGSLESLSVRLRLISELLVTQRHGVALATAEQQLLDLLLDATIDRLNARRAALEAKLEPPASTDGTEPPQLPLEPGAG